jgi:hypothetical protein
MADRPGRVLGQSANIHSCPGQARTDTGELSFVTGVSHRPVYYFLGPIASLSVHSLEDAGNREIDNELS